MAGKIEESEKSRWYNSSHVSLWWLLCHVALRLSRRQAVERQSLCQLNALSLLLVRSVKWYEEGRGGKGRELLVACDNGTCRCPPKFK